MKIKYILLLAIASVFLVACNNDSDKTDSGQKENIEVDEGLKEVKVTDSNGNVITFTENTFILCSTSLRV